MHAAVRRRLYEQRLVVQCAWCQRVSDGAERWAEPRGLALRPGEVTASICPACLAVHRPEAPGR